MFPIINPTRKERPEYKVMASNEDDPRMKHIHASWIEGN